MMGRRSSTPLEGEGRHTQHKPRGGASHTAQAKGRGITHSTSQGEGHHTQHKPRGGASHTHKPRGGASHTAQAKGKGITHSSRWWGSHAALLWTWPLLKLAVVVLDALEYRLGGMHCTRGETLCLANCSRPVHVSRQGWEHTQCGQLV